MSDAYETARCLAPQGLRAEACGRCYVCIVLAGRNQVATLTRERNEARLDVAAELKRHDAMLAERDTARAEVQRLTDECLARWNAINESLYENRKLEAEVQRLRGALEAVRLGLRMHDCRGSADLRAIVDAALRPPEGS